MMMLMTMLVAMLMTMLVTMLVTMSIMSVTMSVVHANRYVREGRFAGNDQAVMATTCVEHPSLCCMVIIAS